MFFWFIATAILAVSFVFRDPGFDYRLLMVGSVVPLLDGLVGGVGALHSVTVSIVLLAVVMLSTTGRRPIRKVLLGLPIGMILHLVFDAAWTDTDVFWWPFTGWELTDDELPVVARGWVSLALEAIGIALFVYVWRSAGLGDDERRRWFRRTGQLQLTIGR